MNRPLRAAGRFMMRIPRMVLVLVLRLYQRLISPVLSAMSTSPYGQTCRFYPSCSEYALVAVDHFGVLRGGRLAIWRLLRCNPWNPGGVDHVPLVAGRSDSPAEPAPDESAPDHSGDQFALEHPGHAHLSDQANAALHPAPAERLLMAGADVPAAHTAAGYDRHAA